MKFQKLLIVLSALFLTIITNVSLYSQEDEIKMEEMDEDEWQRQMDSLTAKKNELQADLNALNRDIDVLKETSSDKNESLKKAESDLYLSVGSTKSKVMDFRIKFESLEKKIYSKTIKKEDADKKFAEIKDSKIKCLPEFWDRYQSMKRKMPYINSKYISYSSYTVIKGDCLWKIAGMKKCYGNPRLWPAIWEANKDRVLKAPEGVPKTIKNPNLIYTGQVLKIINIPDAEKEKYLRKYKSYKSYKKLKRNKTEKREVKKE